MTVIKNLGGGKVFIKCDCGNEKEMLTVNFYRQFSCGCYRKTDECTSYQTHNMSKTPEYKTWTHIKDRCLNPRNKFFSYYGARGIKISDKWVNSFEAFYKDMGPRPLKHSIERIDVNGDYCKENCKWIPISEQSKNKRTSIKIKYEGIVTTPAEVAKILGTTKYTIYRRLKEGWTHKDTATKPIANNGRKGTGIKR